MDVESSQNCNVKTDPSTILNKIGYLLQYEITQNDIERISEMLYYYIDVAKNGFSILDLCNIMTLLEILSERLNEPAFGDIFKEMLKICKIPFFLTRSSDVLTYAIDIQEYFSVLGYLLLRVGETEYQKLVLDVIVTLLQVPAECHKNQITLKKRKRAALSGRFPRILAQIIFLINDELFTIILDLTLKLVEEYSDICKSMTEEDVLNSLLIRIEDGWRSRYTTVPTQRLPENPPSFSNLTVIIAISTLMTMYLNSNREHLKNVPVPTRVALWNVRYVFVYVTKQRIASARNILLACIMWITELFPGMDLIPSGLAEGLISVCSVEMGLYCNDILQSEMTVADDDLMFIRMCMTAFPSLFNYSGGKTILERNRLTYRLLRIISYPSHQRLRPTEHACIIKIISYKILNILAKNLEDEFIENSGPLVLLKNIKNKTTSDSGLKLLSKCLHLLRQTLQWDHRKLVLNSVLFNKGVAIMIELCEEFLNFPIFTHYGQICIQETFSILTIIYNNTDIATKETSIDLSIGYLNRIFHPYPNEPVYDNRILIAIMDLIWEVIVKNETLSDIFFKHNGVYLMLDVLQAFPTGVKIITLGALVDLLDFGEGKCIPYLISWKGKNGTTLIPLLMEIFRNENKALGVQVGLHGEIANGSYPLMGKEQYNLTFKDRRPDGNPAIADMFVSCRPKIYALLTLMQDRHEALFDIAIETYKSWYEHLQAKDQITLLLAENFLGLKFGEVWEELKLEFELLEFEPLPTDAHIINSLVERTHRWGNHLKELQKELLENELVDNLVEEQKTYRKLNDARISQALESLNEAKYLARCTERIFRIAQLYQQFAQVDQSMDDLQAGALVHRTFTMEARVTPIFRQNMSIVDEKKMNKYHHKHLDLVFSKESAGDIDNGENEDESLA